MTNPWSGRELAALEQDGPVTAGSLDPDWFFQRVATVRAMDEYSSRPMLGVFGRLVEFSRRNAGLTITELAERCGIEPILVYQIETDGTLIPEPEQVIAIASALDLPREMLMQLSGHAPDVDGRLVRAAMQFAVNTGSAAALNAREEMALREFVSSVSHD
ncbi:MAG: helix-turn-helix transcriptional regulator [Fimbriimonadaceae bacterium]|nr:helix-turn-helix transcriptional regulator [Fimbriimonadaceae bacterium]